MKKPTTQRVKGWLVLPHHTATHGRGINGQQIYIQKTKPTIILSCKGEGGKNCKALVVPCTIEYVVPKKLPTKKK